MRPEAKYWRTIARNYARSGLTPPTDLAPPDFLPGLDRIWRAFGDLSTCRPAAMGPGPIPWTAIDAYAHRYGLAGNDPLTQFDFNLFSRLIRGLDADWLEAVTPKG